MWIQALCIISQPLMNSNWSYSPETPNLRQNRRFYFSRVTLKFDGWPWKNNRAPLLSPFKLCGSFHRHMWIKTGVTVPKRLNWVLTSVTLTFELWPWPFAWTSFLSMVITPVNFVMTGILWKRCHGQTDGRADGRTKVFLELLGRR